MAEPADAVFFGAPATGLQQIFPALAALTTKGKLDIPSRRGERAGPRPAAAGHDIGAASCPSSACSARR